ncbi:MAG TPA: MotA/TolQ/ExbB proton channel family protein [Verrucomicrobiales bacterium]|nr:MotA/TolQ/ExbB proton channel family protein [Verrucomicrobiales bacterium]
MRAHLRGRVVLTWRSGMFAAIVAMLAWTSLVSAGDEADLGGADESAAGVVKKSLLDVYREGGWMMHVLSLCSAGTIAVAAYCFSQVSARRMAPVPLMDSLTGMMQRREVTNAYELCRSQPCSFSSVLTSALLKVDFERDRGNKASMEQAASETLEQEETRQMLWVNYLNTFATLAPMIGLLGTVVGMIEAFDMLQQKKSRPEDLAGGIGKAMITTAGGLLVGIPAMFFYFFFRNRVMAIVASIQRQATFLIDVLSGEVRLAEAAPVSEDL